jgi:hypothetical protein
MSPTTDLIALTVVSMLIILVIAITVKTAAEYGYDPIYAIILSFAQGFLGSLCVVLFAKGVSPFVHGVRIPFKTFLYLWPVCTVILVPFIARAFEISGNVIVDSLLAGAGVTLFAAVMGTGFHRVLHEGAWAKTAELWVYIALFMAVAIRAIIWALE